VTALLAAVLGPVTNYASAAVPDWAARPWVIWPIFAVLAVASVGLLLWERRLDAAVGTSQRLVQVRELAGGASTSLRPPHVERVRGRKEELAVLLEMLRRPRGRFAVLCGAGGLGKTTLAAQIAYRAEAAGWKVFWVHWRNSAELTQQMVQVALACGLPEVELEAARVGQASLTDVVWQQLSRERRWLVVVDNADAPQEIGPGQEQLADYRGWMRPHGGGLLVVTSRDTSEQTWGPCAELLQLKPLPTHPAGQILLDTAPGAGTPDQARDLAARLGGLPLALRAVGTYLAGPTSRHRTFASYREALEQELPQLLGAEHPGASDVQVARTVVRHTWEVSLDQLAREGAAMARPLLRLLALLAEAPVPLALITPDLLSAVTGREVTPVELEAAFAGLHRYGLLGLPSASDITGLAAANGPAQVVLHPLIRDINALALRTETSSLSTWHRALAERLTVAAQDVCQAGRPAWPAAVLLSPHLPLLLDHPGPPEFAAIRSTLNALAMVLQDAGAFAQARVLHQRVLAADIRLLGPDHPDTLTSRNNLANATFGMGDHAEAVRLLRRSIHDRTRVLGLDHPDTLTSRNDLACALDAMGDHAEAVDLLRQTLDDRTRVLGPEHPHTLASQNSLGLALDEIGDHAEAVRLHQQTLRDRTHVLGPSHPHTLLSRHNLGNALSGAGEHAEAVRLLRQTLDDRTRVLGPEHPHTRASRHDLDEALAASRRPQRPQASWLRPLGSIRRTSSSSTRSR
jgi:Flp pilus assembly protein TadD